MNLQSLAQQYLPQATNQQRNQITQALMNIQNPPPRTGMPPQMNSPSIPAPGSGAPGQMQTPGAPGTPPLGGPPGPLPPPTPGTPGMGIAQTPGLMPQSLGQSLQPSGTVPGGPNFGTPPLLGQGPQPQTPNMVQPPALGGPQY